MNGAIICLLLQVESLQRGIGRDAEGVPEVERELEEVERKMSDLERDREERCRKIMDRRVQQVTTLQELGKKRSTNISKKGLDKKLDSGGMGAARVDLTVENKS